MNNMNVENYDFINNPLNTSKGIKDSYYINYNPVLNKAIEANNNNPESIIHLLAPMGSGKTTFFKRLLNVMCNDHNNVPEPLKHCIMFTPFKVSNQEYDEFKEFGLHTTYILDFAKNVFKSIIDENTSLSSEMLHQCIIDYVVSNYSNRVILIDEGDFKDVQVIKSKYTVDKNHTTVISDEILVDIVIGTLCRVSAFNLSVSANVIKPSMHYNVNNIKLNIPVNNNIKNLFIYNTIGKRNGNVSLEISRMIKSITTNKDHLLGKNSKCLIYTSKFNKGPFGELILNGPRSGVLVRTENLPRSSYINPREYSNIRFIGNDNATLSDELFREFDVMGINTSSSRCTSLVEQYENFWIIIIQPNGITSSCLQSLGRVRNCGVNVLWIGEIYNFDDTFKEANSIDPFFNQYCGYDNTNISYINSITCPYGIRGLNKPVERKFVSRVGERIGDANQVTLEVNRILIEWLEANRGNLKGSLKDYEVYKVQVVNPCGRAKFQEYHSTCKKGGSWS